MSGEVTAEMITTGCGHYKRRCQILSPCCLRWYSCIRCHNDGVNTDSYTGTIEDLPPGDLSQHSASKDSGTDYLQSCSCSANQIRSSDVIVVRCIACEAIQTPSHRCEKCNIQWGVFYCPKCKLWDDDGYAKRIFHCDECGICRIGGRENFIHCKGCAACLPPDFMKTHKCLDTQVMKDVCPICLEEFFFSIDPAVFLRCGHALHSKCFKVLRHSGRLSALRCPLCSSPIDSPKTLYRIFRAIGVEIPPLLSIDGAVTPDQNIQLNDGFVEGINPSAESEDTTESTNNLQLDEDTQTSSSDVSDYAMLTSVADFGFNDANGFSGDGSSESHYSDGSDNIGDI